jgi:hypothetical protein
VSGVVHASIIAGKGYLQGLTMACDAQIDPLKVVVSTGACEGSDLTGIVLSSAMTKKIIKSNQTDYEPWVAGNNNGGVASAVSILNLTWLNIFVISKDDGTCDVGADTSLTASNLLADATGYTKYRRIGSLQIIGGSGAYAIRYFKQNGDFFALYYQDHFFSSGAVDFTLTGLSSTPIIYSCPQNTPTILSMSINFGPTNPAGAQQNGVVGDYYACGGTDRLANNPTIICKSQQSGADVLVPTNIIGIYPRIYCAQSPGNGVLCGVVTGYFDYRGKDS